MSFIYTCTCTHVHCTCVHVYGNLCAYIHLHVYRCATRSVHVCVGKHTCIHMYMCMYSIRNIVAGVCAVQVPLLWAGDQAHLALLQWGVLQETEGGVSAGNMLAHVQVYIMYVHVHVHTCTCTCTCTVHVYVVYMYICTVWMYMYMYCTYTRNHV